MAENDERKMMSGNPSFGSGGRNLEEKKDDPDIGGRRGERTHQFQDTQALQAKGHRDIHSQPGQSDGGRQVREPSRPSTIKPTSTSGGNRPKGRAKGHDVGRLDHN